MLKIIAICMILGCLMAAPSGDKMTIIPGYPADYNTSIYTGYLNTLSTNRSLHYVFVESINGAKNNDPVTLWLNGGPGCSSLLGFLQQIGPYYLQEGIDYKVGNNLTYNPHSWHRVSNLLFLQSPAGVGYSYNLDKSFRANDATTAYDSRAAVIDFFSKFPQYKNRKFYIAGQSYAGKYIPDLAVLIDQHNQIEPTNKINLAAILVGNGVMTFETLQDSTYEYMMDRSFVDPEIIPIYYQSCKQDPDSAGCRYFRIQFDKGTQEVNPYNVYSYCYYNDSFDGEQPNKEIRKRYLSQEGILMKIKQSLNKNTQMPKYNGAPCAFFDGIHDYFNLNQIPFHAKFDAQQWNGPCAQNISYDISLGGSIESYRQLLSNLQTERKIDIILYSGNWDAVVPYVDTMKGIRILNLRPISSTTIPWYTNKQHSGFQQTYSGVTFITVKGASHQVPQSKRPQSFNLFSGIVAPKANDLSDGVFSQIVTQ